MSIALIVIIAAVAVALIALGTVLYDMAKIIGSDNYHDET